MSPLDHDGPPDGDFASYVERLSGSAGRTPGRVEPSGKAAARQARTAGTRAAQPAASPARPASGSLADEAREALRRSAGSTRSSGQAADALRAAGRSAALRLSRWFAIGGIALIAAAVLELFPALSPLPGFTLLMLSFVLRRLSTR